MADGGAPSLSFEGAHYSRLAAGRAGSASLALSLGLRPGVAQPSLGAYQAALIAAAGVGLGAVAGRPLSPPWAQGGGAPQAGGFAVTLGHSVGRAGPTSGGGAAPPPSAVEGGGLAALHALLGAGEGEGAGALPLPPVSALGATRGSRQVPPTAPVPLRAALESSFRASLRGGSEPAPPMHTPRVTQRETLQSVLGTGAGMEGRVTRSAPTVPAHLTSPVSLLRAAWREVFPTQGGQGVVEAAPPAPRPPALQSEAAKAATRDAIAAVLGRAASGEGRRPAPRPPVVVQHRGRGGWEGLHGGDLLAGLLEGGEVDAPVASPPVPARYRVAEDGPGGSPTSPHALMAGYQHITAAASAQARLDRIIDRVAASPPSPALLTVRYAASRHAPAPPRPPPAAHPARPKYVRGDEDSYELE
jgi:hypothetical protein